MGCSNTDTIENPDKIIINNQQIEELLKQKEQINNIQHTDKKNNNSKNYRKNSFEKKSYYKADQKIYGVTEFMEQKFEDYNSDSEIISTEDENNRNNKLKNLLNTFNEDNKKNNKKHKENESKIIMTKNKEEAKKNKKGKKKLTRYKKKLLELEEKEKEMKKREENIKLLEEVQEKEANKISKKKKEYFNKKNKFDTDKNNRESKLISLEYSLMQKEKELKELENQLNPKIEPILRGLNNIGATCYMNASLQCLSNTKELTEYFLNKYKEKDRNKQKMSHEYHKIIRHLWDEKSNNTSYSPNSFKEVLSKENPLFAGIAANDSKDFINFLIERLHQELNIVNKNELGDIWSQVNQTNESEVLRTFLLEFTANFNSPISQYFYGITETKSQCKGCNIIKFNFQLYSFIEFPLQQVNIYYFNNGKRPLQTTDGRNPDVDLYECFEYNRKIDLMTGDNQMYCNICNKQLDSFYSSCIYSGPNYLILNLNRGKGAVYECKVIFPEILDLFNYVVYKQGITAYELYAVICHLGPSSMSGHFVAYCRNRMDNKWYLYNDGFVSLCTRPQQYNDGMPYILFYRVLQSEN